MAGQNWTAIMSSETAPASRLDYRSYAWAGLALAVAGAAFFATKGIVIKLAIAEGISPITTLTWRMIIALPIFLTIGIVSYRRAVARRPAAAPQLLTLPVLAHVGADGRPSRAWSIPNEIDGQPEEVTS